jgi:hypothetical protein
MYWAFQTITTVGYGDMVILILQEYFIAIIWMFAGASYYSYTVGAVAGIIANMDQKSEIIA